MRTDEISKRNCTEKNLLPVLILISIEQINQITLHRSIKILIDKKVNWEIG